MVKERSAEQTPDPRAGTVTGPGRVLVALYALFAVAATSRAVYQIATKFEEAPLAYVLSAFAALVYVVATVALSRAGSTPRSIALVAVVIEFIGVLVIGTITATGVLDFPDDTVWSTYGRGYLFIPLFLPVLGLLWLRRVGALGTRAGS
ncbi:hypothetical protein [Phytoactinopolyspora mesophila]|uniref:Integral membrane protein n=1 Tax=Phytoactinopolyspora mesophila TaxID=2650750 RepID=A0A7K3M458_9ACTN|nr:hypothetical protein [Phytoactinopolyspora mesophila]NDL58103.1 hypothetical protein [Phytoactinopolyspora mesophila]